MKQIDEMFARFIKGQLPLKKKWQMRYTHENGMKLIYFFHYHHIICIYDCISGTWLQEWWETPTDKRGLVAIKQTLGSDVGGMIRKVGLDGSDNHVLTVKTKIYS